MKVVLFFINVGCAFLFLNETTHDNKQISRAAVFYLT